MQRLDLDLEEMSANLTIIDSEARSGIGARPDVSLRLKERIDGLMLGNMQQADPDELWS